MTPDCRAFALAAILVVSGGAAHAAPSSLVAWTPETLKRVASGDPGRGRTIAANCAACHGETGLSPSPSYPSLAGQRATYLYKQLADYKADSRRNDIMTPLASTLTAQDMADVAAYYAAQPLPGLAAGEAPRRLVKWLPVVDESKPGGRLVRLGAPQRDVTACAACHGQAGEGARVGVPALRGQTREYLVKTLQEYRAGQRRNDVYAVMRAIVRNVTDSEIDALADYYAAPIAPPSGVASQ
jgi:cytochrome c553